MLDKILYYYLPLLTDIIGLFAFAAILTAVIETIFFSFFYLNIKKLVFFTNVISNVFLNLFLLNVKKAYYLKALSVGEVIVVLFEFAVFYLCLKPKNKEIIKLFILTFFANVISFSTGYLLLGL